MKSLEEEMIEIKRLVNECLEAVCKDLKIYKFTTWLSKKMRLYKTQS